MLQLASVLLVAVMVVAAPVGAGSRPFTVSDLVAMERISDPQPSPDGSRVAFVVTTMDLAANRGRRDLWLAAVDGSWNRRLTTHPANDWAPRWADDDTLYFLSSRSESDQVWRLELAGGEAEQVTDLPLDVGALRVGPYGADLYVALSVFPECADPVAGTVERLDQARQRKASGMVFDRLFVRHWDTFSDGRRNHVFRVPLDEKSHAGTPLDLMRGVDADCPTTPFGGEEDFAVAPDGRTLVYSAKVVNGSEEAWSTDYDLWSVPTDGSEPARCLTEANPAWDAVPVFSPDGKSLAYLAMTRPGYEADRYRVMLLAWPPGGVARVLTEGWDLSPGELAWSADGTALFATAEQMGNQSLFRIDPVTGNVQGLVTRHTNASPRPLPNGSVLLAQDSLVSPVELYLLPAGTSEPRPVTRLNAERLAALQFGDYRQFSFTGAHGDQVFGYLVEPVGRDPKRRYPLAFLIHGGPQGSFDDHWHYRWNPQVYAAHGYATVTVDFHGSTGYGQAFTDAIRGDWGGAPYEDLMKGLDHVLRTHSWIDPQRMAAAGASYGGYMINWIQGHTDRFKALVCHDGNLDEYMAYFDTEELWFPEWEHLGTPWDNPDGYRKDSPVEYVAHFKTPELVVHGALDYRVVVTHGLATFNALQRRGIPSRLLYFPDENHWVLKPANSIQWHEAVLEWMDRWTGAPTPE